MLNGSKKQHPEKVAMKHFKTGELLVNDNEIKNGALDYCINVLTNNKPEDDFEN